MDKHGRRLLAVAVVATAAATAGAVFGTTRGGKPEKASAEEPGRAVMLNVSAAKTPAPRRRAPGTRRVPILMYHVLEAAPPGAAYPDLYVHSNDFAAQMRWLDANGYEAVTLRRVYEHWKRGAPLPRRPVVLTFDDGYPSVYSVGLPVLRRHGWAGVLNLSVAHQWNDLPPRFIWKLLAGGWELASHTLTHPDLTGLDAESLEREIAGSRTLLRRQYRKPVEFFCYPAGRYDDAVVAAVRKAGYLAATTVDYGLASPANGLFTLRRVRIDGSDGVTGFASKLKALDAP